MNDYTAALRHADFEPFIQHDRICQKSVLRPEFPRGDGMNDAGNNLVFEDVAGL